MRAAWAWCLKYLPEDRTNRYLVVTVVVSVLLHLFVGLLLIVGGSMEQRIISKRGESLLVDIAPDRPKETARLGDPSRPVGPDAPAPPRQAAPPAPPTPPAPQAAPHSPAPQSAAAAAAPRHAPPAPNGADSPNDVANAAPAPPKPDDGAGP